MEKLYAEYYEQDRFSGITSSYWQEYASQTKVLKKGDDFIISGVSYGQILKRSLPAYIHNIVPGALNKYLMHKYRIDKKVKQRGFQVAYRQNRLFDYNCARQMLCVNSIFKNIGLEKSGMVAVIGDGYGFTASLIKLLYPQATVICVNLGKMLIVDVLYIKKVFPETRSMLINDKGDFNKCDQGSILFLEAEKYQLLYSQPVCLFVNIDSMQEMTEEVIKTYFDIMRSSTVESYFYSCNRVEKKLPDGTVIKFSDYPWDKRDAILIDEKCQWCQKFPLEQPPFWRYMDGPVQHRLIRLFRRNGNQ
ncbi:MAG: putative sugar O-methyltransferase [Candidatus Omnitrophica bacterium]|nr:putative sugar O-methyltransferase [Candidatus Omnitrophota bacterium]